MALSLYEAQRRLFNLCQVKEATDQDYLEQINVNIAVLGEIRSTGMGVDSSLAKVTLNNQVDKTNPDVIYKL